jgi:uncharacterized protein (DUF849 family)
VCRAAAPPAHTEQMLKVCLNGRLARDAHAAVPITPVEVAADAVRSEAAGAQAAHVHPRDVDGRESLHPAVVADTLDALRTAAPHLPVGVSTGEWIEPDPDERVHAIRGWHALPDFASVNAHEPGAERVAQALHDNGIGVEAGLWTLEAVDAFTAWPVPCLRVLLELTDADPDEAVAHATRLLAALPPLRPPVLLHGEGPAAWAVLREAVRQGLDTRIGLEDTRTTPDGAVADGNAELVAAAIALGAH